MAANGLRLLFRNVTVFAWNVMKGTFVWCRFIFPPFSGIYFSGSVIAIRMAVQIRGEYISHILYIHIIYTHIYIIYIWNVFYHVKKCRDIGWRNMSIWNMKCFDLMSNELIIENTLWAVQMLIGIYFDYVCIIFECMSSSCFFIRIQLCEW